MLTLLFFFFKKKTAYELRISDWSSDVCSSDLLRINVRNNSGATILNGRPTRITGAIGNLPTVALDDGQGTIRGITTEDILNNANGHITVFGQIGRTSCRGRVCP